MPRRFVSARSLLNDLLNRWEAGEAAAPIAYPNPQAFADITAEDAFLNEIDVAARTRAVEIGRGSGRRRDALKHVRLVDADALYAHLGREPSARRSAVAREEAQRGLALHPALAAMTADIASRWARRKTWCRLGPADADDLRTALRLAQAVLDGLHRDQDYRTFSRRVAGDSKALERLEAAVVTLLRAVHDLPPAADPRAALTTLGIERFGQPLLLSGSFLIDGVGPGAVLPYLGLPPTEIGRLRFAAPPAYVLTIENFSSFNRHVLEADPTREGLTLYIGGYPSLAVQRALATLSGLLPHDLPFHHWSDIDLDGTWIFRTVERATGRRLAPHLMSIDLAERYGSVPARTPRPRVGAAAGSAIEALADYLASSGGKCLEQEQLDPIRPRETHHAA
ncbi:MAG: DUF2220 family protein [Methylobacterium sp.]|uniref:Wadjet anti-phage system protein JetD domain-containing protein n=1 Tax=Methylobacterium sp. TaxID=409 RepID=UPI00271B10AB|nr:Wadjet anti-phage system protein JetD domain-containing protein [Methylobacterium sp.]MDO9428667.1 DUF2220 family protein [Methylobacterium sp.]